MQCCSCGKNIEDGTIICPYCLAQQPDSKLPPTRQASAQTPAPGNAASRPHAPLSFAKKAEHMTNASAAMQGAPHKEDRDRPLGAWALTGYSILFAVPVVGWLLLLIFSVADCNRNLKNFARSRLLLFLLSVLAVAALGAAIWFFRGEILRFLGASDWRALWQSAVRSNS